MSSHDNEKIPNYTIPSLGKKQDKFPLLKYKNNSPQPQQAVLTIDVAKNRVLFLVDEIALADKSALADETNPVTIRISPYMSEYDLSAFLDHLLLYLNEFMLYSDSDDFNRISGDITAFSSLYIIEQAAKETFDKYLQC